MLLVVTFILRFILRLHFLTDVSIPIALSMSSSAIYSFNLPELNNSVDGRINSFVWSQPGHRGMDLKLCSIFLTPPQVCIFCREL